MKLHVFVDAEYMSETEIEYIAGKIEKELPSWVDDPSLLHLYSDNDERVRAVADYFECEYTDISKDNFNEMVEDNKINGEPYMVIEY